MTGGIGPSRPADIPALKALWKQAFGDDDACIDAYFDTLYTPEGILVARERERPVAMACWMQETICWTRKGWPAAYLYAVATEKAARGRGFCGSLLAYAGGYLAPRGIRALLLVPGSPSLRGFYARHGYQDFSTLHTESLACVPADGSAEAVTAPEYLELREQFLGGRAYVSCPVPVLEYQGKLARMYGGGLLRLRQDGLEGCACAGLDEAGRAVLYELLWPGDRLQGASLAAAAVGAREMTVRTPGGTEPFAMVRWLGEKPKLPETYLGIALD